MRDIRQYKVKNDKEVIFTGVYPGDIIYDEDKEEVWVVDTRRPYTKGDRTLASLIKDGYVIPYSTGGSVIAGPRIRSSGLDTDISGTTINVLLSADVEATCPIAGQIDIVIDGIAGIVPLSVNIDPLDNKLMQIELPTAVTPDQSVEWTYNDGGSCELRGTVAPNEPVAGGTYPILVTGTPHVYPFNIVVTTTDPTYAPFQVTGGLLTKRDLGTDRYEFTSDDPIDMVHFTDRGMSGSNTITEIKIVKYTTATSCKYMFRDLHTLHTLDLSGFETSNVTDMHEMFRECLNLPSVNAINFDTSKVTDMSGMFHLCGNLAVADVSGFDTSSVTTTHAMFYECRSLVVADVSNFNTSKITDMYAMFTNLFSVLVLDVSKWDTSSAIKMDDLFNGCGLVASLDLSNFNTHNVTSMAGMFYELMAADHLDLSSFNMNKVENTKNMFRSCVKLKCITNVDTHKVTDPAKITNMFDNCPLLVAPNTTEQAAIMAGTNWINHNACP